jgi:hypothetical protein
VAPAFLGHVERGIDLALRADASRVFMDAGGVVLALYRRKIFADDANIPAEGSGFGGVTLALVRAARHTEAERFVERAGPRQVLDAEGPAAYLRAAALTDARGDVHLPVDYRRVEQGGDTLDECPADL